MNVSIDELLLQVQKKEVEIFDLSLTDLAREFRQQPSSDLYPGSRFIAGLAHLIYLKATRPTTCHAPAPSPLVARARLPRHADRLCGAA